MTNLPIPKYAIGNRVWFPLVEQTTTQLPCPDCLGSRRWRIVTPAGTEHEMACPRCGQPGYALPDGIPSLTVPHHQPDAGSMVVVAIDVTSADHLRVAQTEHQRWLDEPPAEIRYQARDAWGQKRGEELVFQMPPDFSPVGLNRYHYLNRRDTYEHRYLAGLDHRARQVKDVADSLAVLRARRAAWRAPA